MKGKFARRAARYLRCRNADLAAAQGVVSFTFDDAYSAACNIGAEIIERVHGRATYYVCGGLDRSRTRDGKHHDGDDLRRVQERGHEVACHGFGHLNYQETSTDEIDRDLDLNAAYFVENGILPARNFAYPYGCVAPRVKRICGQRFRSARGVQATINGPRVDLALLRCVPLYSGTLEPPHVTHLVQQARDNGAWLIFLGHDVSTTPNQFDMTPELLTWACSEAARCELPILTVEAALNHYQIQG